MEQAKLQKKLNELVKEIGGATGQKSVRLATLAQQARQNQLSQSVEDLNDAMDYLRVCIKYLQLDLEATRRENRYLRRFLEDRDG